MAGLEHERRRWAFGVDAVQGIGVLGGFCAVFLCGVLEFWSFL